MNVSSVLAGVLSGAISALLLIVSILYCAINYEHIKEFAISSTITFLIIIGISMYFGYIFGESFKGG